MKLENELNYVVDRMKLLDSNKVLEYKKQLEESKDFKVFDIRLSNDILKACVPINTICEWYDKYNCNDTHITTLAIKSCKVLGYL